MQDYYGLIVRTDLLLFSSLPIPVYFNIKNNFIQLYNKKICINIFLIQDINACWRVNLAGQETRKIYKSIINLFEKS